MCHLFECRLLSGMWASIYNLEGGSLSFNRIGNNSSVATYHIIKKYETEKGSLKIFDSAYRLFSDGYLLISKLIFKNKTKAVASPSRSIGNKYF